MPAPYEGSCHCGAVRFRVTAEPSEVIHCGCSLCARRAALMATVHESGLTILAGEDKLSLYRWNTGVAQHYFCQVCGIYPFHKKRSMPDHYGVNVKCLDDFDWKSAPVRAAEGKGMPIVDPAARDVWPGPRET